MIVKDVETLKLFRTQTRCEYCGSEVRGGLAPHHIYCRGIGGGSRLDLPINLAALCLVCHAKVHNGQIKRSALLLIVARREGVRIKTIQKQIFGLLRKEKEQGVRMDQIKIDEEFRNLIPPMRPEEYEQLKRNIELDGPRDPIIVWTETSILIAGHNRLKICDELGVTPKVEYKSFKSRDAVKQWMYADALGRRNLTDEQREFYAGKLYRDARDSHGSANRFIVPSVQNEHLEKTAEKVTNQSEEESLKTAQKLAKDFGVSESTIRRASKFAEAVDKIDAESPGSKTALLNGQVPKSATMQLASLPRAKRLKLLAEEQITPGTLAKKLKPSNGLAKEKKDATKAEKKKRAEDAIGVLVRFFDEFNMHVKFRDPLSNMLKAVSGV